MCCSTITIQHRIELSVFVTDLGLVLSEPTFSSENIRRPCMASTSGNDRGYSTPDLVA